MILFSEATKADVLVVGVVKLVNSKGRKRILLIDLSLFLSLSLNLNFMVSSINLDFRFLFAFLDPLRLKK